ncbi:hypothetical protein MMC09_004618 [Bachmanniomyces sp. S44760]|nr:hypothetical protein [Bachmanniomyces sp. S44760]
MPRGNAPQTKVHYKGRDEDLVIFVESAEEVQKWKKDSSIPLVEVVSGYKIFVTHKHGAQNAYDSASKSTLENELGTSNEDECMKLIMEKGTVQEGETGERQGPKNDSMGGRVAH